MTALAGYWDWGRGGDPAGACARMLRGQSVYGREDAVRRSDGIAIGRRIFRRLSEDAHDKGPAVGRNGTLALVGDVRLDDRAGLAAALGLAAAEAAPLSDSALVLRAWEQWDEGALDRLYGDFAFALWDGQRQRLTLARDHLGNCPLHYHQGAGFFAFASMPKGLHALPEIPYGLNADRIADFLAIIHSSGKPSFFEGIDRVEAGHVVTVTRGGISETRKWWNPSLAPLRLGSSGDYVEAMREKLDAAVAARLRGVGHSVATQLSAGLDSAGVTATAARLMAASGGRVAAFTAAPRAGSRIVAPKGRIADEGPGAAATAALYPNVDHVRVETGGRSPLDSMDRFFFHYDKPRLNLCNGVWLDAINEEAKARGLTVLLTAQLGNLSMSYAGDHLFADLAARFRLVKLAREGFAAWRGGARLGTIAAASVGPFLPRTVWTAIARARGKGGLGWHSSIRENRAADTGFQRRAEAGDMDFTGQPLRSGAHWRLRTLRRFDSGMDNKGALGAWGIDIRDPMTDRALLEFCLRIPLEEYLKDGVFRSLARRALADRIPPEIARGTARGYQWADWTEGVDGAREQISGELARSAELGAVEGNLDTDRLRHLVEEWPEDWSDPALIDPYRHVLLRAVSAAHFVRKVEGGNA